jgi:MFS transporter, DHA1 family, inner membrane transport protein
VANALGAWVGGLVIAAGLGYRAPSAVGAGLAVAGLIPLAISAVLRRRDRQAVRDLPGSSDVAREQVPVG